MKCEACERNVIEIVEPCDDPVEPYQVCGTCHKRLLARALRPLEWYNLAKRHGWYQFLLHDDFYDEEGRADQAEIEIDEPEKYLAPSLTTVKVAIDELLDYSITRWSLSIDLADAWNAHPKPEVLAALEKRFCATKNAGVRACVLEIAALCLGDYAAEFVRGAWNYYPNDINLGSLAQASAGCLPQTEGYGRVRGALDALGVRDKRNLMYTLAYFRSAKTLDWVEANIIDPVTDSWGHLAASSAVDWPRLERWLLGGRPLSLVAIDTLRAIQHMPTKRLQERQVGLANLPSKVQLQEALETYASRDPVPRVRQRVDSVIANYELLRRG